MPRRSMATRANPSMEMTLVTAAALGTLAAAASAAATTNALSDTTPAKRIAAGALVGVLGGSVAMAGTLMASVALAPNRR